MTAKYTDAEKAAAKRFRLAFMREGRVPQAEWLADFRRMFVDGLKWEARRLHAKARAYERSAVETEAAAANAGLIWRAIRREQRRAAREALR